MGGEKGAKWRLSMFMTGLQVENVGRVWRGGGGTGKKMHYVCVLCVSFHRIEVPPRCDPRDIPGMMLINRSVRMLPTRP